MQRAQNVLANELAATLRSMLSEAVGGDQPARRWLLTSFPGHKNFLVALWTTPTIGRKEMSFNGDGRVILDAPSEAQLAENRRENELARQKFDRERAEVEAAKTAALAVDQEAAFKEETRALYSSMSTADFERLWVTRLRDDALIARAKRLSAQPRESDRMYSNF